MEYDESLLEDLARNLPGYRWGKPLPVPEGRLVEISLPLHAVTMDMLVSLIYSKVRDPAARKRLSRLDKSSEELLPVVDALLYPCDYVISQTGNAHTRTLGRMLVEVPEKACGMEEEYAEFLRDKLAYALRTIGIEDKAECTLTHQKK